MFTITYSPENYDWVVTSNVDGRIVFAGSLREAQTFVYDNDPSAR